VANAEKIRIDPPSMHGRSENGRSANGRAIHSKWRRIVTPIPAPESLSIIEELRAVEARSMSGVPPILWQEAEGFLVRDPYGNQWIDLTSGIVAANAGHSHPRIVEAIQQAAGKKLLFSYAFPTKIRKRLLEKLVQLSPIENAKAILFSAGTEATECAMALMRRHGQKISPEKVGILSFQDSFHGRTFSASMAAGSPGPNDWITREKVSHYQMPYPFDIHCPWDRDADHQCGAECFRKCLASLAERGIGPEKIAGILTESVAGWATWPLPTDFAQAMAAWAREHDILLTFDEIQAGCGRTGKFFGFEHCGVVPDLITLGKGLTSSLPASAVIGRREILDQPNPGEMSSTHGGSPVCAAAALANLQVLEEEQLVAASAKTGEVVLNRLKRLARENPELVRSVHGPGLFISMHLKQPDTGEPHVELADAIVAEAICRGVMMFPTARGFLKIAPPLCIDPEAALEAVEVLCDCFVAMKEKADTALKNVPRSSFNENRVST